MFFFRAASGCMRRPAKVVDSDCQLVYLNAVSPTSRKSLRAYACASSRTFAFKLFIAWANFQKKVCACGRRAQ